MPADRGKVYAILLGARQLIENLSMSCLFVNFIIIITTIIMIAIIITITITIIMMIKIRWEGILRVVCLLIWTIGVAATILWNSVRDDLIMI